MIKLTNILNELEINKPKSNLDILKEMLDIIPGRETSYFDVIKWNKPEEYDDEDDEVEVRLSKYYHKWIKNKSIYWISVEDHEDLDFVDLPNKYSKIITWGGGYNNVTVLLHNFN